MRTFDAERQATTAPGSTGRRSSPGPVWLRVANPRDLIAPWGWGVLATIGLLVVADIVWMSIDRSSPSWDQSSYLQVAWDYIERLRHHGVTGLPSYFMNRDPGRGPLYTLGIVPFLAIFGPHPNSALLLNIAALIVLLCTVAALANRLGGRRAVLPSVILTATMPIVYGLSRQVLTDFLLTTLCVFALLASIKCAGFANRKWSAMLGAAVGLAALTKVTAPGQVAFGILVGLFVGARAATDVSRKARLWNALIGVGILAASTLWWYVPHLSQTREYIKSTTSGTLSLGTGPNDPLRLHNIERYVLGLLQAHVGWMLVWLGLLSLLLLGLQAVTRRRAEWSNLLGRDRILRLGFIVAWIVPPIAVQAANKLQDGRLVAPALIGIPVCVGIVIGCIERQSLRSGMTALSSICCGVLLILNTLPGDPSVPGLPSYVSFASPLGPATMVLDGEGTGYALPPRHRDDAGPVTQWLLHQAALHHMKRPLVLGVLETHPEINGNTISWLDSRDGKGMRIIVVEPQAAGLTEPQIAAEFATYDAVAIVPDLPPSAGPEDRAGVLNELIETPSKAGKLLAQFDGPSATFPVQAPGTKVILRWRGTEPST